MKNTLGERIRQRRKELKLTQLQVAKKVGVSHVTVSQWESDIMKLKAENLYHLAKLLNTNARWLLSGEGSTAPDIAGTEVTTNQITVKRLPVLDYVQAASHSANSDYSNISKMEWEDSPSNASNNAYWLKVVGDSMSAQLGLSIIEGMMVLVDPDETPKNGSFVIAKLENVEEVTFKKLAFDAGEQLLNPLNQSYRQIQVNENCQIIGVVTELRHKL